MIKRVDLKKIPPIVTNLRFTVQLFHNEYDISGDVDLIVKNVWSHDNKVELDIVVAGDETNTAFMNNILKNIIQTTHLNINFYTSKHEFLFSLMHHIKNCPSFNYYLEEEYETDKFKVIFEVDKTEIVQD